MILMMNFQVIISFLKRSAVSLQKGSSWMVDCLAASKPFALCRDHWYPIVLSLFLFPLQCVIIGIAGFVFNISLSKWHAGAALLSSASILFLLSGKKVLVTLARFGVMLLVISVLIVIYSIPILDYYDSSTYHRPAAVLMAEGWNPLWNHDDFKTIDGKSLPYLDDLQCGYIIKPFPKAQWIFGALTYLVTGNTNAGSYTFALYAGISLIIAFWTLGELFNLSLIERILAALVVFGNTIVIGEAFDGMIDGLMGSLLTILVFAMAGYLKTKDVRFLPFITGSIPYVANIKLTGLGYAMIIIVVFSLPLAIEAWRQRMRIDRRYIAAISLSLFLTAFLGINPYLFNTLEHGHPGYPYMGKDNVGDPFITQFVDPPDTIFHGTNRIQRFATSHLISQPRSFYEAKPHIIRIRPEKVLGGGYEGMFFLFEIGGFGTFYSIGFAASLALMFFVDHRTAWIMMIAILASVYIMPHNFVARYVPQLWMFPPLVFCAIRSQSRESRRFLFRTGLVFWIFLGTLFLGGVKTTVSLYELVRTSTEQDIYMIRFVRGNPTQTIIELQDQWQLNYFEKLYVHDCGIDAPQYRYKSKNECQNLTSCGTLKSAPVFIDPKKPNESNTPPIAYPPPKSLLHSIADLRWRQFKNAWNLK